MDKVQKASRKELKISLSIIFLALLPLLYVLYVEIRDYSPVAGIGWLPYLTLGVVAKYIVLSIFFYKNSKRVKLSVKKKNLTLLRNTVSGYMLIECLFVFSFGAFGLYSALEGLLFVYGLYAIGGVVYATSRFRPSIKPQSKDVNIDRPFFE